MKKDQALVLFNHDLFTPSDNFVFKADKKDILDLRMFKRKHKSTDICTTTTSAIRKAFIPSAPAHWTKEASITPLLLSET